MNEATTAHIYVFATVLALLCGAVTLLTALRAREGRDPELLRPLISYLIVYNLHTLAGFTNIYTAANIFGGLMAEEPTALCLILSAVTQIALVGMAWTLFRCVLRLLGIRPAPRLDLIAGAAVALFALALVVAGYLMSTHRLPADLIHVILSLLSLVLFVGFITPLAILVRRSRPGADESPENRRNRAFGQIYGGLFLALFLVGLIPEHIRIWSSLLLLPALNLGAFFWLRRHLPSMPGTGNNNGVSIDDPALLDAFCARYDLSQREREIAELIVQGKSNKEIEDLLFISIHTVKNHIYRLYRKVGVNSRGQFVNLLLEEQKSFNGG